MPIAETTSDTADPCPADHGEIRRRYEETDERIQDICADVGISLAELDRLRRRGQWRRQKPRPFTPPHRTVPTAAPSAETPPHFPLFPLGEGRDEAALTKPSRPPSRRVAATPAARRRLLDRLVAAISLKLEQLERQMSKSLDADASDPTTATDHERETRAIGALIDNLEKIMEMEAELSGPNSGSRGSAAADANLADEAERCRRELAERLSRIVEAAAGEA